MSAPVVDAIFAKTNDARVRLAMMLGALLEGGSWSGPWSVGDSGTSFGPFQMHYGGALPQPTSSGQAAQLRAQAQTPDWAVAHMLGEYQGAVAKVPAALWASDPETAAEQAARLAERPAQDYFTSRGHGTVDQLWHEVTTYNPSGPSAAGDAAGSPVPGAGTTATNVSVGGDIIGALDPSTWLGGLFGGAASAVARDIGKLMIPAIAVSAGAGLVVLGLYRGVQPAVQKVQTVAADAAKAGAVAA